MAKIMTLIGWERLSGTYLSEQKYLFMPGGLLRKKE